MAELKRLARDRRHETRNVIGEAVNNLPAFAAVKMPTMQSMKKTVQRTQRLHDPFGNLVQPETLDQLVLPDALLQLSNGENFLLHDNGQDAGVNR